VKIQDRIAAIEAEYGESFMEIVEGYAADGESMTGTAGILEIPLETFRRWVSKHPHIVFPGRGVRAPGVMDKIATARKAGVSWRKMPAAIGMECNPMTLRRAYLRRLTRQ
jgi:hypothetical protein